MIVTCALRCRSSNARCAGLPLPAEAYGSWPGRVFASAISSLTFFSRQRRVNDEYHRRYRCQRDRRQILDGIVGHALEQALRDRDLGGVSHEDRVSVGRRLGGDIGAYHAAGARTIVDHDLLAPRLRQLLRDHAREDVGGAAGRIRCNDADRPRWIYRA
jgi:hypothetical protein